MPRCRGVQFVALIGETLLVLRPFAVQADQGWVVTVMGALKGLDRLAELAAAGVFPCIDKGVGGIFHRSEPGGFDPLLPERFQERQGLRRLAGIQGMVKRFELFLKDGMLDHLEGTWFNTGFLRPAEILDRSGELMLPCPLLGPPEEPNACPEQVFLPTLVATDGRVAKEQPGFVQPALLQVRPNLP